MQQGGGVRSKVVGQQYVRVPILRGQNSNVDNGAGGAGEDEVTEEVSLKDGRRVLVAKSIHGVGG